MSPKDFIMKWVLPTVAAVVIGFGIGRLTANDSEFTDWDKALLEQGHNLRIVQYLMDLPTVPLTTDTLGNPAIAPRIFWTEEKDGEPSLAVLYEVKGVFLNNVFTAVVDTVEATK